MGGMEDMGKAVPVDQALADQMAAARELLAEIRGATKDMRASMREFEDLVVCRADRVFNDNMRAMVECHGRKLGRALEESERALAEHFRLSFRGLLNSMKKATDFFGERSDLADRESTLAKIDQMIEAFAAGLDETTAALPEFQAIRRAEQGQSWYRVRRTLRN